MAITWGAEYTYQANLVQHQNCCELPGGKFVAVYQNTGGASEGVAVVGSVVDSVITWGPPSQFSVADVPGISGVCPLGTDKFVVVYSEGGDLNHGWARVGVVTGLNIAWGAAVEFQNNWVLYPSCCQLGTDKFGIGYNDRNNWDGYVCICSVVGNVITCGVPVIFTGAGTHTLSVITWGTDKFLLGYWDVFADGYLRIVTAAGLVPTCHAPVVFEVGAGEPAQFEKGIAKVDTDKFAISWRRGVGGADPNNAQCVRMGSVIGNVITLGPYYVLNPFPEYTDYICVEALTTSPAQFVVLYPDDAAGPTLGHGTYNILDFSGTTITNFGAKQYFTGHAVLHLATANLLTGRLLAVFQDQVAVTGDGMIGQFILLPTVTTNPATNIEANSGTLNGTLDDDGGEACDCGFEWGETIAYEHGATPTESKTTDQTFSQIIGGLTPSVTYHFRAFATNLVGTSYGSDRTFIILAKASVMTLPATGVT